MKIDARIAPCSLASIPEIARGAEQAGFDAIWSSETQHDPFLPLALVSEQTERMGFGTSVAIAFARSPATLAYTAWDLAEASMRTCTTPPAISKRSYSPQSTGVH